MTHCESISERNDGSAENPTNQVNFTNDNDFFIIIILHQKAPLGKQNTVLSKTPCYKSS